MALCESILWVQTRWIGPLVTLLVRWVALGQVAYQQDSRVRTWDWDWFGPNHPRDDRLGWAALGGADQEGQAA